MRSAWCVFVLLAGIAGAQGENAIEQRLSELEAKAARADVLAARVSELEAKLEVVDRDADSARLEEAILSLRRDSAMVHARKASGIVFGGQLRLRSEYRMVVAYGAARPAETDEDTAFQRTRLNADARVLPDLRVFVEIQDSRIWGEEQTVLTDVQGVDLHQGYADFEKLFGSELTLRAGRFELSLWNQRLLSPLDWSVITRSWDGLLVFGKLGEVSINAGFHPIAEDAVIDSDKDTDFYWASATFVPGDGHELGGAFFWSHSNTGPTDYSFGTATIHAQGRFGGLDYALDLVAQFGENERRDVEAYAIAVDLGYTFDGDWKPRLGVEWTWASGDDDPTDGDVGTFNPLFPFGHFYQGYLDIFSWRNGHDLALHFQLRPSESFWAEVALHGFWLDDDDDAWYASDLTPIRTAPGADRHVGIELDLSAKYWLAKNAFFWFGYSHFFPGDFVEESGDDPATDWFWVQFTVDF